MTTEQKSLGRTGLVGRFRPLHSGAAVMLEEVCKQSEHVMIGIGSSNKYNARNPFTPQEAEDMIRLYLDRQGITNYSIVQIPDFGHLPECRDGQAWRQKVTEELGSLDYFVTGNDYVKELLEKDYPIIHSYSLVPKEKWIQVKGSIVRMEMALGHDISGLVPKTTFEYMQEHNLIERFRKEFGLETLAGYATSNWDSTESNAEEKNHVHTNN